MKNNKIKSIIFTFSIITLLIASSVSSFGGSIEKDDKQNTSNGSINYIKMPRSSFSSIAASIENLGIGTLAMSFDDKSGVFRVTDDPGDESNPSIVVEDSKILVAYENFYENMTRVRLRNSVKYGQSWSQTVNFPNLENYNTSYPAFDKNPGEFSAYGVFISEKNNSGMIYEVYLPDIKNINNVDVLEVDWSKHEFYNFMDTDIVTYPEYNCKWVVGLIGSTNYEDENGTGPCVDAPMFCFNDPNFPYRNGSYIAWEPDFEDCRNLSIGRDHSSDNETIYAVCEQNNGTNNDLLFIIANPYDMAANMPFVNMTFTDPEGLRHPNIFVRGDDIFITAESGSNGIVIYHSKDSGQNWNSNNIATGKNPVLFANETNVTCIFVESGNQSIIFSENDIASWTDPVQVNDQNGTVLEGYHNSDIPSMDHVIWTDNRDENHNLYMVLSKIPETDLEVEIDSIELLQGQLIIPTRNRIRFKIKNVGAADVYNIDASITYECAGEDPVTITYDNCITQLNSGTSTMLIKNLFKMSLNGYLGSLIAFAGLQNLTVTVHHEDDTNPSNDAVTLYGPEEISYETIFPKLYMFEDLFKTIKTV